MNVIPLSCLVSVNSASVKQSDLFNILEELIHLDI